jgi:DNA-binding CsgD family transcriptional regulator
LYESKVDRSGGLDACHLWTASVNEYGYGMFGHDGETLAARWAYKRYVGPLTADEVVRHTCDNPPCQNRGHWLKGTQPQNILDAVSRSRQHRPRGEKNVKAKLTEEQVIAIRSSSLPSGLLMQQFGVSRPTINSIRARITWKHVA